MGRQVVYSIKSLVLGWRSDPNGEELIMLRSTFAFSTILVFTLTFTEAGSCQELMPFIDGEVTSVISGDTLFIKLENARKFPVKLQGIAAPEKKQPYASESRQKLTEKVMGKNVRVYFRFTDSLGRVLGKIIVKGEDIGLSQISYGHAWFYRTFPNELLDDDLSLYMEEEAAAKKDQMGLWKDRSPVAPWTYRAVNKIQESLETDEPLVAQIRGNKRTKYYLRPDCGGYKSVPAKSRVLFSSESEAVKAGYSLGKTCK
jgi:endonuclease YncB( thermonuclease family)